MKPFRIRVGDAALDDLRARLRRARRPGVLTDGDAYGVDPRDLRDLCAYWADGFDWRRIEGELNEIPQFTATIEGRRLHFAWIRSPEPGAHPLVLLHGWPGSFREFRRMIGPLTDPRAHGVDPADAFDLVVPSLPGYLFSEPSDDPGYDYRRVAGAVAALMESLGYARFGAAGGDAGAAVAAWLGADFPKHLSGIHLTTVLVGRPPGGGDPMDGVTAEEAEALRVHREVFLAEQAAHLEIQGTRPQTLAYALEDSPVGLAAWFLDKVRMWSDPETPIDRDEILTNLTLYWATGSVASSMRYYHAVRHGAGRFFPDRR
ncbi:MAG: alpha/beta fold hydrolase, partial [Myxococcales bacterium]|nr:alpha/beta fold hydrolase [Myxococcales bacterium]